MQELLYCRQHWPHPSLVILVWAFDLNVIILKLH